jgi:hypothetical protein
MQLEADLFGTGMKMYKRGASDGHAGPGCYKQDFSNKSSGLYPACKNHLAGCTPEHVKDSNSI